MNETSAGVGFFVGSLSSCRADYFKIFILTPGRHRSFHTSVVGPLWRFWVLGFGPRSGPGFGFWAAPRPGFWVLGWAAREGEKN